MHIKLWLCDDAANLTSKQKCSQTSQTNIKSPSTSARSRISFVRVWKWCMLISMETFNMLRLATFLMWTHFLFTQNLLPNKNYGSKYCFYYQLFSQSFSWLILLSNLQNQQYDTDKLFVLLNQYSKILKMTFTATKLFQVYLRFSSIYFLFIFFVCFLSALCSVGLS